MEEIDWSVGEILRALAETGQERDTLVVFTSDNGPWLQRLVYGGSAGLLREGKATTWEGGVRVPFLARQPGRVQPGRTSAQVGSMLDLLPTFAAMAGVGLPSAILDGEDLTRELCTEAPARERTLFIWNADELCAVRRGRGSRTASRTPPSGRAKRRNTVRRFCFIWKTTRRRSTTSPRSTRTWSRACRR